MTSFSAWFSEPNRQIAGPICRPNPGPTRTAESRPRFIPQGQLLGTEPSSSVERQANAKAPTLNLK